MEEEDIKKLSARLQKSIEDTVATAVPAAVNEAVKESTADIKDDIKDLRDDVRQARKEQREDTKEVFSRVHELDKCVNATKLKVEKFKGQFKVMQGSLKQLVTIFSDHKKDKKIHYSPDLINEGLFNNAKRKKWSYTILSVLILAISTLGPIIIDKIAQFLS